MPTWCLDTLLNMRVPHKCLKKINSLYYLICILLAPELKLWTLSCFPSKQVVCLHMMHSSSSFLFLALFTSLNTTIPCSSLSSVNKLSMLSNLFFHGTSFIKLAAASNKASDNGGCTMFSSARMAIGMTSSFTTKYSGMVEMISLQRS